jgi:hypothetical protein
MNENRVDRITFQERASRQLQRIENGSLQCKNNFNNFGNKVMMGFEESRIQVKGMNYSLMTSNDNIINALKGVIKIESMMQDEAVERNANMEQIRTDFKNIIDSNSRVFQESIRLEESVETLNVNMTILQEGLVNGNGAIVTVYSIINEYERYH